MNYYIDFEATQFTGVIISVGCINENGDEFYSLVKPDKPITKFITDLTHITQAELDVAPSADEVFDRLFEFCSKDNEAPTFICYGDSDSSFAKSTLDRMATTFKAKSILSYIYANVVDFCPLTRIHFGVHSSIKLIKVANYYLGEEHEQTHNALEDAKLLKYVYEQVQAHDEEFDAFPEYRAKKAVEKIQETEAPKGKKKANDTIYFRLKKGRVVESYNSLEEAIAWVLEHKFSKETRATAKAENIGKRIRAAAGQRKQYCSITWAMSQ